MARLMILSLVVALSAGCSRSDREQYRELLVACDDASTVETRTIPLGLTADRVQQTCERLHGQTPWLDEKVACVLENDGRCERVYERQLESGLRTLQQEGRLPAHDP